MNSDDKIKYALCYKEVIHKFLSEMGLSPNEASLFVRGMDRAKLKEKFTGTKHQLAMLIQASQDCISFEKAVNNFVKLGDE
jgi:hypothetical protein